MFQFWDAKGNELETRQTCTIGRSLLPLIAPADFEVQDLVALRRLTALVDYYSSDA